MRKKLDCLHRNGRNSDIADLFNTPFSYVDKDLASKITGPAMGMNRTNYNLNYNSIVLRPTCEYEISTIIKNMKNKAGSINGISI